MAHDSSPLLPYPLKIALLAPLIAPIAQPFVGGAQVFLYNLGLGLARRGHHVTLFAAPGSRLDYKEALAGRFELAEVPVKPGELKPADFNAGGSGPDPAFFR